MAACIESFPYSHEQRWDYVPRPHGGAASGGLAELLKLLGFEINSSIVIIYKTKLMELKLKLDRTLSFYLRMIKRIECI